MSSIAQCAGCSSSAARDITWQKRSSNAASAPSAGETRLIATSWPGKPDQLVAIKRVSPALGADAAFDERFCQVMSRAAELEHPAHCAIEDIGRAPDGSLYVAMQLVAGKDLARVA